MFLRLVTQLSDSGFDPDDWLQLAQIFQVRSCLPPPPTTLASRAERPACLTSLTAAMSQLLPKMLLSRASCTHALTELT